MIKSLLKTWLQWWGDRGAPPPAFPGAWETIVRREAPFYRHLPATHREALRTLMTRFVARKKWWGAEDLRVTEEMKVIVAAYACLLVLGRPDFGLYERTREIILFPREFGERVQAIAPDGTPWMVEDMLLGETHYRGPVLLAWESIKPRLRRPRARGGRRADIDGVAADEARTDDLPAMRPEERGAGEVPRESPARGDVILHEFAHALDSLDGLWDGTPPLKADQPLAEWVRVFTAEYDALVRAAARGRRTFLDPYGAEDPTEFFAVATEAFFLDGRSMKRHHPALYDQLVTLYHQDPAGWNDE